jgi:hypothetical protein
MAVVAMSGTLAVCSTMTARAAQAESGSVEVSGLPLAVQLICSVSCTFPVTATSSGSISGVDGTTPFTVSWADPPVGGPNLSGVISYSSSCLDGVWTGAAVGGSDFTITGAQLVYGTSIYSASVTLHFGGTIEPGLFVPMTNEAKISGGPVLIDLAYLGIPGALPIVPNGPPIACGAGTQNFTASGVFFTAA